MQFVGEGTGSGDSPLFADNDGAAERAYSNAEHAAKKDLARLQRLIACYECGYQDPRAVRRERLENAVLPVLGVLALGLTALAALADQTWAVGALLGLAAVGLIWGRRRGHRSRVDDHVIFLDDKSCALPRRSRR